MSDEPTMEELARATKMANEIEECGISEIAYSLDGRDEDLVVRVLRLWVQQHV